MTAALLVMGLVAGPAVSAGGQAVPPPRPSLAAAADTNDWEPYFDRGVDLLRTRQPREAQAAFFWSSRLDPTRAEPVYAQWVAFWLRHPPWFVDYVREEPRVLERPEVRQADSLRYRALLLNPLVHQGLMVLVYDEMPGRWGEDPVSLGWLAYGNLEFERALRLFGLALTRQPDRYYWLRYLRALAFTASQQYDSAQSELTGLVDYLRRRDEQRIVRLYESKAFFEYALARLYAGRGNRAAATDALGRALLEDLGFYPARMLLGRLALERRDFATAVREFAQATEVQPDDPGLREAYGNALALAGRGEEAEEQLRQALALDPYYAASYFTLARTLEQRGDTAGAVAAYEQYLLRAPRKAATIGTARQRLRLLVPTVAGKP